MDLMFRIENLLENGVEVIDVLRLLRKRNVISTFLFETLLMKYTEGETGGIKNRTWTFITDMKRLVPFKTFVSIIQMLNGHAFTKSVNRHRSGPLVMQTNAQEKYTFRLMKVFSNFKGLLDDSVPTNKVAYCVRVENAMLNKALRTENDALRQFDYDQYVTAKFMHIQQLRDKTFPERIAVIEDMRNNIPGDISRDYSELVYHCKKASSHANAGNLEMAESLISDVLCQIERINNTYLKIIAYHDSVYVYRVIYTKTRNAEYMQKIAGMCYAALKILEVDTNPEINFFRRLFNLNMVQVFLGVDIDLQMDYTVRLQQTSTLSAMTILKQVRSNMNNMESRREMILQLCQTRIHEEDGDTEMAIACITRALVLSQDGAYFPHDKENIETYQRRLMQRLLPMPFL